VTMRCSPAVSAGFDFWRLPLPDLDEPGCPESAFSVDFWSLPLPPFNDDVEVNDEKIIVLKPIEGNAVEPQEASVQVTKEQIGDAQHGQVEENKLPPRPRHRNLAAEMTEMFALYAAERDAFHKNLAELGVMQAQLRALTVTSAAQHATVARQLEPEGGIDVLASAPCAGQLPPELTGRVFWQLDVASLARAMYTSREWARHARVRSRWQHLCTSDWGLQKQVGSWQDYRLRLARWRSLQVALAGLSGSDCPSGICGSLARRRLFDALESLVELGAARDLDARYPAAVPELLRSTQASGTLLTLLEDESPHLVCLSVCCLADLVARCNTEQREELRSKIFRRGALIRRLLEGDDADIVESAARMMLNLHGSAPGIPIATCRRGPVDFASTLPVHGEQVDEGLGADTREPETKATTSAEAAHAWSGVWCGDMCYARGGERHAVLRLILGTPEDPALEQAIAGIRDADAEQLASRSDAAGGGSSSSNNNTRQLMRAEGGAEYWRYFGFGTK